MNVPKRVALGVIVVETVVSAITLGWNLFDYRHDIGAWIKAQRITKDPRT